MNSIDIAAAALIAFAVAMVVISVRRWNRLSRSMERVEALKALVAESAALKAAAAPQTASQTSPISESTPAAVVAPATQTVSDHRFVVSVPDNGNRHQMSFQRTTSGSSS